MNVGQAQHLLQQKAAAANSKKNESLKSRRASTKNWLQVNTSDQPHKRNSKDGQGMSRLGPSLQEIVHGDRSLAPILCDDEETERRFSRQRESIMEKITDGNDFKIQSWQPEVSVAKNGHPAHKHQDKGVEKKSRLGVFPETQEGNMIGKETSHSDNMATDDEDDQRARKGDNLAVSVSSSSESDNENRGNRVSQSWWRRLSSKLPVFDPDGYFKRKWDWVVVLLVLYIALVTPYDACFIQTMPADWDGGQSVQALEVFGFIVDCIFIIDIALNFNTGYVKPGAEKVTDRQSIVENYLKGFFGIDLVSSIPIDWFLIDGNVGSVSMAKCIRLLRLGRLMRKLDQLRAASALRVVKLMFAFMLVCHWSACGWYFLGVHEEKNKYLDPNHRSWTASLRSSREYAGLPEWNLGTWYQVSYYWSLTTLTTIGYGDIVPVSDLERLYTITIELLGNVVSAVIIGNVAVLISSFDASFSRYRDKLDLLNDFVATYNLPKSMYSRILVSMDYFFQKNKGLNLHTILDDMSPGMRAEIYLFMYRGLVENSRILNGAPEPVVKAIVLQLRLVECFAGDLIVRSGDPAHEIFFLRKGSAEVKRPTRESFFLSKKTTGGSSKARKNGKVVESGSSFGDVLMLARAPYQANILALEPCELLVLDECDLEHVLRSFPDYLQVFRQNAMQLVLRARNAKDSGQMFQMMLCVGQGSKSRNTENTCLNTREWVTTAGEYGYDEDRGRGSAIDDQDREGPEVEEEEGSLSWLRDTLMERREAMLRLEYEIERLEQQLLLAERGLTEKGNGRDET